MNIFDDIFIDCINSIGQYNFMNERLFKLLDDSFKQMDNNPMKSAYFHGVNLTALDLMSKDRNMFCVSGYGYEGDDLVIYTNQLNDELCKFIFQNSSEIMQQFIRQLALKYFAIVNNRTVDDEASVSNDFDAEYRKGNKKYNGRYYIEYLFDNCTELSLYEQDNYFGESIINIVTSYIIVRNALVHNLDGFSIDRYNRIPSERKRAYNKTF